MSDYEKLQAAEAVNKINNSIFLPDIQRSFVWKPEQIYTLFDSIMRNYPINTMLFWKQTGADLQKNKIKKLKFVFNNEEDNKEDTTKAKEKDYYLVLDGQQRLTTFNIVLRGNYIIRKKHCDLYFNIQSGKEENDDGILYEFFFFDKNKGECFYEDKVKPEDQTKIWYNIKHILDYTRVNVQEKVKEKILKTCSIKITEEQASSVLNLFFRLKYDELIYFYSEKEADYNKVLDIFESRNRVIDRQDDAGIFYHQNVLDLVHI